MAIVRQRYRGSCFSLSCVMKTKHPSATFANHHYGRLWSLVTSYICLRANQMQETRAFRGKESWLAANALGTATSEPLLPKESDHEAGTT